MKHFAAILLALLLTALLGDAARAHAVLVEARPADGTALAKPPQEVVLRFNEPVAPVLLRVLDADGKQVADPAAVQAQNETLRLALPALIDGTYVVSYRVLSTDSHPVTGSIVFTVGEGRAPVRSAAPSTDPNWTAAFVGARLLFVVGLLLSAGGILALWCLTRLAPAALSPEVRFITQAAWVAIVAGALSVGIKGCQLAGAPALGLLDPAMWRIGVTSTLATSVAVAAAGLLAALQGLRMPAAPARTVLLMAGSLVAVGSFALTGHAASAPPKWIATPTLALHVLCVAFWLGALRPLLTVLRTDPDQAPAMMRRFSAWATVSVALLLAAGAVLAFLQVRQWEMFWQSLYGVLLLVKFGLAVLLLLRAAGNKWKLTPMLGGPRSAVVAMRAGVRAEYVLFAGILALTATLTQVEPPRSILQREATAAAAAPFSASRVEAGFRVTLSVDPARTGHNAIAVEVAKADGAPAAPKQVDLELSLPAAGIEPIRRAAEPESPGRFVLHSDDLILAGRWRIDVQVLVDDFTAHTVTFEVPVR